jgi:beta-lactamase regulating signal transducer with metallopeptidase domain
MLELLLESALRLLALGGIVWLILKLPRFRNPQVQMTAWTVVLLASLSMPVLMRFATVTIPVVPPLAVFAKPVVVSALPFAATRPSDATLDRAQPTLAGTTPARSSKADVTEYRLDTRAPTVDWWSAATAVYFAVAAMLVLRLLIGLGLTWRLAHGARRVTEGWAAGADVRVSDAVAVPVTFGTTILLPPECSRWDLAKRRAVLSHEGSHVGHGDCYVLVLAALNRAVFWFSPFAWWQLTCLAELAETISDDAAIEIVKDRPSYAGILLEVARKLRPAPAGLAMARPGTVRRRIERILAATTVAPEVSWRGRALLAVALLPLVVLSSVSITRATTAGQPMALAPAEPVDLGEAPLSTKDQQAALAANPFDQQLGYYQLNSRAVFTVSRTNDQLFAQLTGQRKVPLRPAGEGEYFYGTAASRISFVADDRGTVTALLLRRNGQSTPSPRVDAARAAAAELAFAQQIEAAPDHFRDQLPAPNGKQAVLRGIEELKAGAPNYHRMSASLADDMSRQLPKLHAMLTALGDVESIFFRGVGPGGYDIYGVKFANGLGEFRLLIAPDGTVEDLLFRPDGDDTPGGIAGCADESTLKSAPDTAPIKLMLFNESGAEVTLYSVDFAGHRTRHATIGNEMTVSVLTHVARPWIVADPSGKCLEIIWPGQRTRYLAFGSPHTEDRQARPSGARRTPAVGAEDALRRYIEEVARGEPTYDRMTAEVAGETRRQLMLNQAVLKKLGPLRAISFRGVTSFGSDIYIAHFAHGSAEWRIALVRDGRIGRLALGPAY